MEQRPQTLLERFETLFGSPDAIDIQLAVAWLLLVGMMGLLAFLLWRRRSARDVREA